MGRGIIVAIAVILLLAGLVGATYASYAGFGLVSSGGPSARVGSIFGPAIVGGGPGSGK